MSYQTLFGQNQLELPDIFFMKCEIKILNYDKSCLIEHNKFY